MIKVGHIMTELKDIVREEVRRFLYEKSYVYSNLKSDPNSFLSSPKTSDDQLAAQLLATIEDLANRYNSHKLQKFMINNVFDFSVKGVKPSHFIRKYTKKYLNCIRYVLNHIEIDPPLKLLQWYEKQMGPLKTELNWVLEYLSYTEQKEEYFEYYEKNFRFFGIQPDQARKQFEEYQKLIRKHIKEDYS